MDIIGWSDLGEFLNMFKKELEEADAMFSYRMPHRRALAFRYIEHKEAERTRFAELQALEAAYAGPWDDFVQPDF